jgi:hypothetical protein
MRKKKSKFRASRREPQSAAQTLTLREGELLERKTVADAELPASARPHSSFSTLAGKPVQLIKKTN